MSNLPNPFELILSEIKELREEVQELSSATQSNSTSEDRYISKKEAADYASVSVSTIANWAREGKFKRYYFGNAVRYYFPEIKDFLANR